MVREDQLQNGLPGVDDAGCVGADDHPLRADGFAGRSQVFASFDLYDADAADTGVVLAAQLVQVEVAERRNFDADRSGRFDQVGARATSAVRLSMVSFIVSMRICLGGVVSGC